MTKNKPFYKGKTFVNGKYAFGTIWNMDDVNLEHLKENQEKFDYVWLQKDKGKKTEKDHYHFLAVLSRKIKLSPLQKLFCPKNHKPVHVEQIGNWQGAVKYLQDKVDAGLEKLFEYGDKPEKGVASELREKYPLLRTQQVVYALLNGEIVRLFVKGASLGSDSKAKDVTDFYSYISSFTGNEHFFLNKTILNAVEEQGDLGSYYVVDFKKGEKITEEEQNEVEKAMVQVADYCRESDEYYQKFFENNTLPKDEKEEHPMDVIEYPENDDEEIPF